MNIQTKVVLQEIFVQALRKIEVEKNKGKDKEFWECVDRDTRELYVNLLHKLK